MECVVLDSGAGVQRAEGWEVFVAWCGSSPAYDLMGVGTRVGFCYEGVVVVVVVRW